MRIGLHLDNRQSLVHPFSDFLGRYAEVFRPESHIFFNNRRNQLIIGILKNHPGSLTDRP
jgi:hypothetical protein